MSVLGEVLVTARRARGLTQQELADLTGVSQAALSRWENQDRVPGEEHVAAVARALGVTRKLLEHASRIAGATAVDAHMRRQKTAKAGVWLRLEAQLNMYRIHANQLLDDVAIKAERQVPRFDVQSHSLADAARLVRMQWRMPIGPVRGFVGWLEAAGCLVVAEDFGTLRVDGLSQWAGAHPVMLVNAAAPVDRIRWTLAHELGHLVLHEHDASVSMEDEAEAFAAESLMPAEVIKPQLRRLELGRLHDLKRQWMVPMAAIIERAYRMGLLTATERTRFYKARSARGWIAREPVSDELPPELPRLPQAIANTLVGRGLSDAKIQPATAVGSGLRVTV